MRKLGQQIRRVWLLRQAIFSLAMAAFIFGCVAFRFHPRTPFGTQCPTAPTVKVKTPIVCCGEVIGYELRDPMPSETGFVQCQCAEKATAKHFSLPPRLDVFVTHVAEVQTRAFIAPFQGQPTPSDPGFGRIKPPPVPPPPITA